MRVFSRLLIIGTAVLMSGCSLDYMAPGLMPDVPHASTAPRVAAYYTPEDHGVLYDDSARVKYGPLVAPH